jgi:gamma-glutamylcyclotransferase (GGCT)/AIG2-like uncharacterized protein YtfP
MSSQPHLFVYGTLQSGFVKNRYARYLAQNADFSGPARIRGRLYGLTRYPGLRPPQSEEDWVSGELYRLRVPVPTLQVLDAYEASDYRRVWRVATLENGRQVRCWVYLFRHPLPRHRRVGSGEWGIGQAGRATLPLATPDPPSPSGVPLRACF